MPTPVNIVRQCLSPESVQTLDDAVSVANRRSHNQTTSLHVISALLSLPTSPLRDACARARNSAYATRIQFKALELCLNVSLDRLSTTPQRVEHPPVSNSLLAAVKRSQANQRRQPENYNYNFNININSYNSYQHATSSTSVTTVKVELKNLILSILDDPVVSRVFGESGFRSSDIKLSILRPVHRQLQPVFLCNINFPFNGFLENNEIYKKINQVLVNGKNPLLVGPSAVETCKIFLETKLTKVVSVKNEILTFVTNVTNVTSVTSVTSSHVNVLDNKLEEVGHVLKSVGSGVMVEYGDVKELVCEDNNIDAVKVVVKKLGELVKVYGGRVWLIGCAEDNETCVKFFKMFPLVEEEWDLHVLHINSVKPVMPETFPKSSLMESFVPFGGFFSLPTDIRSPLRVSSQFGSLCHVCDEKLKLEVNDVSKGGLNVSVSDLRRVTLPSWLQSSQVRANNEMNVVQAQDDPVVVNAKIIGLQKKWHDICQRLHQGEQYLQILPKARYTIGSRVPSVVGFQVTESTNQIAGSSTESVCDADSISNSRNIKDSCIVGSRSGSTASGNSVTTDMGLGQIDQKDSKLVYNLLLTRVGRQEEVLGAVSQTIARCRARPGPSRAGIWFCFLGPDRAAKKKTAVALAEILLGGRENMICVDLSFALKLRGKNIIDIIADELIKKPLSVVFLENVDTADMLTQQQLSRASSTGRFSDSHGREVSISNAVFVLTSKFFGVDDFEGVHVDYTEENVLKAKCGPVRLLSGFDLDDMRPSCKVVHVTRHQLTGATKNKRKHCLDLNLPADESEADYDSVPENSNAWLEDVLEHMDEKVIFKPFDFDSLAEKVLTRIGDCFESYVGLDCSLEIDYKVMEQILKASCVLETVKTEDWIEQVLGEAFVEAQRKYGLSCNSVLKLVSAELPDEQFSDVLLPDRIIMS